MADHYAILYDGEWIDVFHHPLTDEDAVSFAQNRYISYDDLIAVRHDGEEISLGGWNIG